MKNIENHKAQRYRKHCETEVGESSSDDESSQHLVVEEPAEGIHFFEITAP